MVGAGTASHIPCDAFSIEQGTQLRSSFDEANHQVGEVGVVHDAKKAPNRVGRPKREDQRRGARVRARRPNDSLLDGHFSGQQVEAVVVGWIWIEGLEIIYQRDVALAKIGMVLEEEGVGLGLEDPLGLKPGDWEFRMSVDQFG